MSTKNPFDISPSEETSVFENTENQANSLATAQKSHDFDTPEEDPENSDDSVWVIQKAIWGIVKSLVLLAVIVGLVWFVWGGTKINSNWFSMPKLSWPSFSFFSKDDQKPDVVFEERNQKIEEKEVVPVKTETIQTTKQAAKTAGEKNPGALLVRWSLWMHRTQTAVTQNEIEKTLKWQLGVQNYFGNDVLALVSAPTLAERTHKVSKFERRLSTFKQQGTQLDKVLRIQQQTKQFKLTNAKKQLKSVSAELESKLKTKNYFGFEALLRKKQAFAAQVEHYSSEIKIRNYLINEIKTYQTYLSELHTKLDANRTAILSNIKVKPFVNDPFKRLKD